MVKQKKYEYKQKLYNCLSEYINQNPKEYWNILKSVKNKTEKDEIPEVLKDEEVLIKHFQDQGKPSSINNAFMIDTESQLKLLENNIDFKAETDAPISCSEVKKVISGLKLQKSAGPDRIINEIIKTSNQVIIKSIVKIFNLILKKGLVSIFSILIHTTIYVVEGRVMGYTFTVNDYCEQCTPGKLQHISILYNEILENLEKLSAINAVETCRFYNEIYDEDISAVNFVRHTDIPVVVRRNYIHQASNITKAYEKLTEIALYYQLGRLHLQETSEGLSLPDISARIGYILCGLQTAADVQGSILPTSVCRTSISLPFHSRPQSRTRFAAWLFSVLQFSRKEYCSVFNEISGYAGSPPLSCSNLPNVADFCK
ncbi:unnamed protein product [Mytilus coruscus]|uniref:Uncharacterized protein n=1 Tax=Mytilus coruscus TaxID=42192 RepID=A0A6J8BFF9_MYTCO|nr:unnamed protein product [Mytilus coruscus]